MHVTQEALHLRRRDAAVRMETNIQRDPVPGWWHTEGPDKGESLMTSGPLEPHGGVPWSTPGPSQQGGQQHAGLTDKGPSGLQTRGGLRANAIDGGQQQPDFMVLKGLLNVPFQFGQATAQHIEIFAGVADLYPVDGAVMTTHRLACGGDEGLGQVGADRMAAIVPQIGQPLGRDPRERRGRGTLSQQCRGQLAIQRAHMAGEFRKAHIH